MKDETISNGTCHRSQHRATSFVTVHALSCGYFSLPEYQFVHPVSIDARRTVPSLAFLIQHINQVTGKRTRILFDLGLRKDVNKYALPIQKHLETRQPITTDPDVVESLAKGGLSPDDIDYVIYSHVSRMECSSRGVANNAVATGTLGPHRRASGILQIHLYCRLWIT